MTTLQKQLVGYVKDTGIEIVAIHEEEYDSDFAIYLPNGVSVSKGTYGGYGTGQDVVENGELTGVRSWYFDEPDDAITKAIELATA